MKTPPMAPRFTRLIAGSATITVQPADTSDLSLRLGHLPLADGRRGWASVPLTRDEAWRVARDLLDVADAADVLKGTAAA